MRPTPRPGIRLAAAAVALVVPLTLAACGGSDSEGDDSAETSETTAPAEDETTAADTDTSTSDVTSDGGSDSPEKLDEFPSDVPLVEGKVEQVDLGDGTGGETGGTGILALVIVDGTDAEAYAEARELLTGAGYDVEEGDVENSGLFRNDTWTVAVSVLPWEQGKVAVQYSVLSAEVY